VRKQDVAFDFRTVPVDHHVDRVAGLNRDVPVGRGELFDRHQAFGLVSEIDDHFLIGDLEYPAFEDLTFRGGAK